METEKCSFALLSSSPLPAILIINESNHVNDLNVYSINGKILTKQQLFTKVINPILIKDMHSNDYFTYIGSENITIHCLPTLEIAGIVNIAPKLGLVCILQSDDKSFLYCINKNGTKVYGIEKGKKE